MKKGWNASLDTSLHKGEKEIFASLEAIEK